MACLSTIFINSIAKQLTQCLTGWIQLLELCFLPESIHVITKLEVHFLWIISHIPWTWTVSASKQFYYIILGKQSILSAVDITVLKMQINIY